MVDTSTALKSKQWRLRPRERRNLLLVGDFLVALIALGAALLFWASSARWLGGLSIRFLQERPPVWFYLLPFIWLLLLIEMYDVHRANNWRATLRGVAASALIGFGIYLLLYFYFSVPPKSFLPRRGVAGFLVAVTVLTLLWRYLYIRIFTAPRFIRRAVIMGAGRGCQVLLNIISNLKPAPYYIVGVLDDDPQKVGSMIGDYPILGGSEQLLHMIEKEAVSDIIVAISGQMQGITFQTLLDAQEKGVEITRMPVAYEELVGRVPILLLEADWVLRSFVDHSQSSGFYEFGKRMLDIVGGLVGTILLALTFPFISLALLLDNGMPIFYSQNRVGKGGHIYPILKYRTMITEAEPNGRPRWAKEDDARATRVGRILRKTHLDELPQFINVMRGEMSLVGPRAERPELMVLFQRHVPFYRSRLLVKPGITGWAQINFGYAATVEETITKLEYDLYYIKHRNLLMDIIILLRTPATIFELRGQ